jgi:serine/threonine-protein kinase
MLRSNVVDVTEPVRSRRSIRTLWGTTASEEEARAYLQARLTTLWKFMFWAFVVLVSSQWMLYTVIYPKTKPWGQDYIYATAIPLLAVMAFIWRGILLRRRLTIAQLYGLDVLYAIGSGLELGAAPLFAWDFSPSHYVSLVYAVFVVFTRAIVIPSSGKRTTLVSTATFVPCIAAAIALAIHGDTWPAPPALYASAAIVLSGVAVLLASIGSDAIYGLRRKVSEAQQLGQYTLERRIGEGGMGAVYRARHVLLRRPTAVKLLLPDRVGADNLERFEREVQHMSQLTHPNTVAVFDYGRSPDGVFYYAMEYLGDGIDLEQLVRTYGPLPSARAARILAQVCGALHEAHARGIVHRDIKPPNIILCERGLVPDVAKVVDFGLVKEITADAGGSQQVILGTPAYIAPEAVTDPSTIGPAADLYALGAVGYFLVTGQRVFQGKTAVDLCIQHVTAQPKPPSSVAATHVAPELEAIVMRCLAKQPKDRYASAEELAAALATVPGGDDWSHAQAVQWWREFRKLQTAKAATAAAATLTITVDLGDRADAA